MSPGDRIKYRLQRKNLRAQALAREADKACEGMHVRLVVPLREWHGGSRHPAGRILRVYCVHLQERGGADQEPLLWLARLDKPHCPRVGARLSQIEFVGELTKR